MASRWTDAELLEGLDEYLQCLRLNEGLVTPQEADQQLVILEGIRARVEEEISWVRSRTDALSREPTLGFPEINFVSPTAAVVSGADEG